MAATENHLSYYGRTHQQTLPPPFHLTTGYGGYHSDPNALERPWLAPRYNPALASARRAHNDNLPISQCPAEILIQIFLHTLSDRPSQASVLLLGAVCSRWRQTAWATSELWTTLCISIEYNEYESQRSTRQLSTGMLEEWMQRTATRPVTLAVRCSLFGLLHYRTCPFITQPNLLNFLCSHANRWEHMELCIPQNWLQGFRSLAFPSLKTIRLDPFENMPNAVKSGRSHIFQWVLPSIDSVRLIGVQLHPLAMPWAGIRSVSLVDVHAEGFISVLPHLKGAVEIRVTLLWGSFDRDLHRITSPDKYQAQLPSLRYLTVFASHPGFATNVFSALVAPGLKSATVNIFPQRLENLPDAVQLLVVKSKLKKLELVVDLRESSVTDYVGSEFFKRTRKLLGASIDMKAISQ